MINIYKILPVALLLLTILQLESRAQTKVGTGAAWANGVEEFGFNINASFLTPVEGFRIAGGFSHFFVDEIRAQDQSFSEFNLNGLYEFLNINRVSLYGLGGVNLGFFNVNVEIETPGFPLERTESETKVGLNIGGGIEIDILALQLFGEGKHVFNELDQAIFTAGIRFDLGGSAF